MGGTLDPIHSGHVYVARTAREILRLDRVMLLPAGDPPHKAPPTPKADRMEMARFAAADCEGLFACALEIERAGVTYTVDTLRELSSMNPDTEWFYLVGADTLDVLDSWRDFGEVAKLCTFAVNGRADEDVDAARMHELEEKYGARFVQLPFNGPEISSTDVRTRVAEGRGIDGLVPESVERYIRERGLYLCGKSKAQILDILRTELKPGRYRHTLGVAETARRLAPRFGVDPARAELAGLLHDCANSMPIEELRSLARAYVPDVDEEELAAERVVHAPAGCVIAAQRFGVKDRAILSAIRKHTLGGAEMSAMDALIYVADFVEPNRREFPGLAEARELAENDIFAAARLCAKLTNDHVMEEGGRSHSRTLAMLK